MLRLPPHETSFPTSIADAVAQRVSAGAGGAYVAGGTDLYPNMKRRQQEPRHVVDVRRIPELNRLEVQTDGTLVIGAGVVVLGGHALVPGQRRIVGILVVKDQPRPHQG